MSTYRTDMLNSSNMSTNRLLSENDTLTQKYNQYKRNILNSTNLTNMSSTKHDYMLSYENNQMDSRMDSRMENRMGSRMDNRMDSRMDNRMDSRMDNRMNNSANLINTNNLNLNNSANMSNMTNMNNYNNTFIKENYLQQNNTNETLLQQVRKQYEERIKSLHNQVKILSSKFDSDEILNTMKNDSAFNNEFMAQRLRELIDETLMNEKEELITGLTEENAELRVKLNYISTSNDFVEKLKIMNEELEGKVQHLEGILNESYQKNQMLQNDLTSLRTQLQSFQQGHDLEYKKLHDEFMLNYTKQSNEIQKLKSENLNLSEQVNFYDGKLKEVQTDYEENKLEMDRLQKVISVLEIDLNACESKIKDKQSRVEALQHEMTNLQTQYFEANLRYKKFMDENKSQQSLIEHYEKERKDMLDKYSSFNDDLQKSHNEKLETQEKKNKEKFNTLKKKIVELKGSISSLEEEIKNEKNNSLNIKINYSKVYTSMQEDMKLIKNEWEKKLREEQMQFEKILSELENKHSLEINNLTHDFQIELENKMREFNKHKQNSDLLKNFDKEFIRVINHEEIVSQTVNEIRKKFEKEFSIREEELECELKRKFVKLEEEKKGEYEFLTENIRKNLKNLEKANDELKESTLDLQNKLQLEKGNNERLSNLINQLQKTIRTLTSQNEEKENYLKSLSDKTNSYEETLKSFSQSNKNFKSNVENLLNNKELLEQDNKNLLNELKSKEELNKEELNKIAKNLSTEKEKFESEYDSHMQTKNKLTEYENLLQNLQSDNNFLINKCNELEKNCEHLEAAYENQHNRFKQIEKNYSEIEKKNLDLSKTIKNFSFEKSNANELVIKILKTKLTSIRSELSSIKAYYNNELSVIKKEYAKTIETLFNTVKIFTLSMEREFENNTKRVKESLEKEFKVKLGEKDNELQSEIKKVEGKFEKHLLEQFRVSEKLEKENKNLIDQQQANLLKCKEHVFKIQELETEIKNLNNQIGKVKVENDFLNETVEKLRLERVNFNKLKNETEDAGESNKRETIRRLQTNLSNLLLILVKMKKKYNQEIINFRSEIEELSKNYESEISGQGKYFKSLIDTLDLKLGQERDSHKKIRSDVQNKESEFNTIQKDLERLKDIYENKIKLLNTKINADEGSLKEMKNDVKNKNEQLKEATNYLGEYKTQINSLKTQLELKSDEIFSIKKEYEKLLTLKEKKIYDLQSVVNQSLYSYNSGLNNIKIANKLDDEVKVLMKRARIDDSADKSK